MPVPPRAQRRLRPRGCRAWLLAAALALVFGPLFLCGSGLVLYLLVPPPQIDILILGLDGRAAADWGARTDTIMLVGVDPALLRVSVLSIPRDVFIETPGYGLQRINAINVLGEQDAPGRGPALLSAAIEQTLGIRPDRYVRLDFRAFADLVDAVGGVTITVERAIVDNAYPTEDGDVISVRFDAGVQHLDGQQALMYVRTRHTDDDYRRAERQQQVLSALVRQLQNPAVWPRAWSVVSRAADTNLSLWDLVTLAPPALFSGGYFETLVMNRDYLLGTAQGWAVPNLDRLRPWLSDRFE